MSRSTRAGWVRNARHHGRLLFIDLDDPPSTLQLVADRSEMSGSDYARLLACPVGSAIRLEVRSSSRGDDEELRVISVLEAYPAESTYSAVLQNLSKLSRTARDNPLLLDERHLALRTDYLRATLTARSRVHHFLVQWFASQGYTEIHAPILTKLPLYEDSTAVALELQEQSLFLTQCVGFYLEACANAIPRVVNIGPSFRAEESKSRRHLVEYWHVKFEAAWESRNWAMAQVERLLADVHSFVVTECEDLFDALDTEPPDLALGEFRRVSYSDIADMLRGKGHPFEFGDHIGADEERALAEVFSEPLWICGNPRTTEPFPYRLDPEDPRVTRTADLVLPNGYGELLGVAEKIVDEADLQLRMDEKGKGATRTDYAWVRELRSSGFAPQVGVGMGFERLLRWLFQVNHVRDFSAFPRLFGRSFHP
jgi:asparaginyl-tRNA synthetase